MVEEQHYPFELREPPRDGEFFFEDEPEEAPRASWTERAARGSVTALLHGVTSHPVLALGTALLGGVVITSLAFQLS